MRFITDSLPYFPRHNLLQISKSRQLKRTHTVVSRMPVTVINEQQRSNHIQHPQNTCQTTPQNNRPRHQRPEDRPQKGRPQKPAPGQPTKANRQLPISPILSPHGTPVPLIDIGANLTSRTFSKATIPQILARASQSGVTHIILTGTSYLGSNSALELCSEFDGAEGITLRCTVGVHPHDATKTLRDKFADSFI